MSVCSTKWSALTALLLVIGGCGQAQQHEPGHAGGDAGPSVIQSAAPDVQMAARTMQMWARSCALCHVDGSGGAPRVGHAEEWLPRLAQGDDVLLQHTLEGLNNMPPLGYCMACEVSDFSLMISFMTDGLASEDSAGRQVEAADTP